MQLADKVSLPSKRYAAAALAHSPFAPKPLVLRLAAEPVEVSAPLLGSSPLLSAADLINLIAKCGTAHARAIARRPGLDPAIAALLELMTAGSQTMGMAAAGPTETRTAEPAASRQSPGAEHIRDQLRGAMASNTQGAMPAASETIRQPQSPGSRLIATARTGNRAFFQTALADALDVSFAVAGSILDAPGYLDLMLALKGMETGTGDAFLICCLADPVPFARATAPKLFMDRYAHLSMNAALDRIEDWRNLSKTDGNAEVPPLAPAAQRKALNDRTELGLKAS